MDMLIEAGEILLSRPKNQRKLRQLGRRASRFKVKVDVLGNYYVEDAFTGEIYIYKET